LIDPKINTVVPGLRLVPGRLIVMHGSAVLFLI